MPTNDVDYLLVNPPLTDPTAPSHSIAYLVGATRQAGFPYAYCVDANIEALDLLADPANVADLLRLAAQVREAVEVVTSPLTRREELRYRAALAGVGLHDNFVLRAIEVFRDPELCRDYPTYRQAVLACHRWLRLLSLRGAPDMFETGGALNRKDLTDPAVLDELNGPFTPYLDGPFASVLRKRAWQLIGFSVDCLSQLPFAVRMAAIARRACPSATVVFCGTEMGDIARRPEDVDLIVPSADPTTLVGILSALRDGTDPGALRRSGRVRLVNESLATLPTPAYDVWDWRRYWAPEPERHRDRDVRPWPIPPIDAGRGDGVGVTRR